MWSGWELPLPSPNVCGWRSSDAYQLGTKHILVSQARSTPAWIAFSNTHGCDTESGQVRLARLYPHALLHILLFKVIQSVAMSLSRLLNVLILRLQCDSGGTNRGIVIYRKVVTCSVKHAFSYRTSVYSLSDYTVHGLGYKQHARRHAHFVS